MRKNSMLIFTKILYGLFLIGTIITLLIVYIRIDTSISFKFLIGYVLFAFFMLLYVPIITIINSRKLKWVEIRKRLLKLLILFVFFAISHYIFDFFSKPSKIDLFRELTTALSLAFGISFIDVTFLKKE